MATSIGKLARYARLEKLEKELKPQTNKELERAFDILAKDSQRILGKYFAGKLNISQIAIRLIVNADNMKRITYQLEEKSENTRKKFA